MLLERHLPYLPFEMGVELFFKRTIGVKNFRMLLDSHVPGVRLLELAGDSPSPIGP